MRATDSVKFSNISATTADFPLAGGKYQVALVATFGGGNVIMSQLAADGVTIVAVSNSLTANGLTVLDLPPGLYRFSITTATGVFITVTRVPGD